MFVFVCDMSYVLDWVNIEDDQCFDHISLCFWEQVKTEWRPVSHTRGSEAREENRQFLVARFGPGAFLN